MSLLEEKTEHWGPPAVCSFYPFIVKHLIWEKLPQEKHCHLFEDMLLFGLTWLIIYISVIYPSIFLLTEIFNNFHVYYTLIPSCCKNWGPPAPKYE